MNITVVGTGYAGLPHAAVLAKKHLVYAVDKDKHIIDAIRKGINPISEPGLDALLNNDSLVPTTNLRSAIQDSVVSFICVGTPALEDGRVDLSYVDAVSEQIGRALCGTTHDHVVVVKSTVPPRTTRERVMPRVLDFSKRTDIGFAMNPEFLQEGLAVYGTLSPDRIIVGVDDEKTGAIMKNLYKPVYNGKPVFITSLETAEMAKYASNVFLAMKIAFANEVSNVCEAVGYGVDSREVLDLMSKDDRINPAFLRPSRGFGGSCFPKDVSAFAYFADKLGHKSLIAEAVYNSNKRQPLRIIRLLENALKSPVRGKSVGVLGLAFKAGTDDIRNSSAIPIIQYLIDNNAKISAYDSVASPRMRKVFPNISYKRTIEDVLEHSDAVLVLTRDKQFMEIAPEQFVTLMNAPIVIDGESVYYAKPVSKSDKIIYRSIGLGNYKGGKE